MAAAFDSLKNIFFEAQDSQNQYQLIKAFRKVYSSMPFDSFLVEFLRLVKHPLVIFARETAVEKTVDFVSKAVTDLAITEQKKRNESAKQQNDTTDEKDSAEEEDKKDLSNDSDRSAEDAQEDDMHPLLLKFFEFLLKVHSAKERGVRFRVCQLVTSLLQNLGEKAEIDDDLYDSIYRCMLERLQDKCPIVRVHAVRALAFLQDPGDSSCPVTKAYIHRMSRDPNVEVRRIILTSIAPSVTTLPAILERTHDVKETVRRTSYTVLAERIPLRALTIEQRIKLLHDGLQDRSDMVKTACSQKLLQAWLAACEGSTLTLLERLDVQSSVKTCEKIVDILLKTSSVHDLVQGFDIINERSLIDVEKLTCESAFYWRVVLQFVFNAGYIYDEQLDKIRPNVTIFCSYIESFTNKMSDCTDIDDLMDYEFILQQLLQILSVMDLSDSACWKSTQALLHTMLVSEVTGPSLMVHVLPCLKLIYSDKERLINYAAETISEIREPIMTVEKQMSKERRRDLDKKIAGIRVKLNQLREELDDCIAKQDFEKAAQIKLDISSLDLERSNLMNESDPKIEEVRIQKNDPITILKCLVIFIELLTSVRIKAMTPTLHTLVETEILPGMMQEDAEVRNAAVKAIGLCCLVDKNLIMQHLPLLLQASQMDTNLVRATALKSIFDVIHVYGLEAFTDEKSDKDATDGNNSLNSTVSDKDKDISEMENSLSSTCDVTTSKMEEDRKLWSETAIKVITILSACLDDENTDLRNVAAEGFSKLLLSGRVVSSKLFSHLLLLWYNPTVEDDETLLHCLGVFFPRFAFSSRANQEMVEDAFLPTIYTILKAPTSSPLAEINEINVAQFLTELMDSQNLLENQRSKVTNLDNPCHDSLAVKLCNEILSKPDSFNIKVWLKILGQLTLSSSVTLLKDLHTMCGDIEQIVTEKSCVKLLETIKINIGRLLDEAKQECEQTESSPSHALSPAHNKESSEDDSATQDKDAETVNTKTPQATSAVTKATPCTRKPPLSAKTRSVRKTTSRIQNTSHMDDSMSMFATPGPLRRSRVPSGVDDISMNMENLLIQSASKTSKTPRSTKRPLHSIQDPTFTG